MALKNVAVNGLTLSGVGISGGVVSIISVPSVDSKVDGNGIFFGNFQFSFSGGNFAGYDPGTVSTVGVAVINPSAIFVKVDGSPVLLEGDNNPSVSMTGLVSGVPVPFVTSWSILSAGQTKVKAI